MITEKDFQNIFEDDRKGVNSITFEQIPYLISKVGKEVAEYTAYYEFLDGQKKNIIAEIFNRSEGTIAERENKAYGSAKYVSHLENIKIARERMLFFKTQLESLQAKQQYFMSVNSTLRAEMSLR